MMSELRDLVESISDLKLRKMVRQLLDNPEINLDTQKLTFEESPGGAYIHHAYEGGLIQHTVAVTHLALTLCKLVEEVYGGKVNRDLVLAGAVLHDVMKCYVYIPNDNGGFTSSDLGDRIDHLSLLIAEMYKREFPIDLIHVVASHHGEKSPISPRTVEALIVSIADFADSEFSRRTLRAAEYLLRRSTGKSVRCTSAKEALEVLKVKAKEGWQGIHRLTGEET